MSCRQFGRAANHPPVIANDCGVRRGWDWRTGSVEASISARHCGAGECRADCRLASAISKRTDAKSGFSVLEVFRKNTALAMERRRQFRVQHFGTIMFDA